MSSLKIMTHLCVRSSLYVLLSATEEQSLMNTCPSKVMSPSIKHILITEETVTVEGSSSTGALFRAGITSGIEQRKEKYLRIMT